MSITTFFILNVHLPVCTSEKIDDFILYVHKITKIISPVDTPIVYVMRDIRKDHRFGKELIRFCKDENLTISDGIYLSSDNAYTYFSDAHSATSKLDHIVCTTSAYLLVIDITGCYERITSDHLPLCMCIKIYSMMYNNVVLDVEGERNSEHVTFNGTSCLRLTLISIRSGLQST